MKGPRPTLKKINYGNFLKNWSYDGFSQRNIRVSKLWPYAHIYKMNSKTLLIKSWIFKKIWSKQCCWYHQNSNHIYESNLLRHKKVKRIRNYVKMQLLSYILIYQKLKSTGEKNADVSRINRMCHVIHIFFGYFLGKIYLYQFSLLLDM